MTKYIFRRKVYETEPEVLMHQNIYDEYDYAHIQDRDRQVDDELVCECNLSEPQLKDGNSIYLKELGKKVFVDEVIRTDGEEILCYISPLKRRHSNYEFLYGDCERVIAHIDMWKRNFADYKKTYKYKHRFFNFKR